MKNFLTKFSQKDDFWQKMMGKIQIANLPKPSPSDPSPNRLFRANGTVDAFAARANVLAEQRVSNSNAFNIQTAQNYYKNQVYGGSVRASSEFYENLRKQDDWDNSVRGQELKVAASFITGNLAGGYTGGNEKKARKLSQSETNTLSLAGAL